MNANNQVILWKHYSRVSVLTSLFLTVYGGYIKIVSKTVNENIWKIKITHICKYIIVRCLKIFLQSWLRYTKTSKLTQNNI